MAPILSTSEAQTEDDRRAEAALDAAPLFAGKPYRYARVMSGITNLNYRVWIDGEPQRYFLKLHGANTGAFIDRKAASEATRKIGAIGIGPPLVWEDERIGAELQVFLDDFRACTFADILEPHITRNILTAYRKVHGSVQLSVTRTVFDALDQHREVIERCGASPPRDLAVLLAHADRARRALAAAGVDLGACFNDSYASNYMVDAPGDVRMIDWEYASNADPHSDLAIFFCSLFRDGQPNRDLIEQYLGHYDSRVEARVLVYEPVALLRWAMWSTAQTKLSALAFDYTKYGGLLYTRARRVFASPLWNDALAHI